MDYGYVIKRATEITWRYKFLWIFGIIMALCGQGGGGKPRYQMNYRVPYDPMAGPPEFPDYFPEPLGQTPIAVYLVAGLLLLVVFGLISIIVAAIGRGALIKAVDRVEDGQDISFAGSWRDGLATAVPMGVLQALLYIPWFILIVIAVIIVFTQFWPFFSQILSYSPELGQGPPPFMEAFFTMFPTFLATICGLGCLFFILQIMIALFLTFGSRSIVLENQGVLSAFSRSWFLFRKNIGATVLLAILIVVITSAVGLIIALPTMAIMFPLMISTMPDILSEGGPSMRSYLLLGGAGLLIALVFSVIGGIVQVFVEALWTLAYREFVSKTV